MSAKDDLTQALVDAQRQIDANRARSVASGARKLLKGVVYAVLVAFALYVVGGIIYTLATEGTLRNKCYTNCN